MLIATLLIIDFYGYGLLYSSDILALQFISPLVIFVIWYCYHIETESDTKNYTYPVAAFILLVTFILLMSVSVGGTTSAEVPFIARKGVDYKDLFTQFKEKLTGAIESRLDIATAGLYRGNVEKNRYESLGVYFGNIRAADPRFYTDEPITVWGTLRSKTYKDAVIVSFNCSRWKDSKRIYADKIIPEIKFPIFTLEEVDTQCTFLPKEEKIPAGANIVTLSAEYNFGTDSYLKTYFMVRERFRASAREGIDPLTQFGIKDKKPLSVSTNGPVEIGLGAGPLVTVSEGYAVKPTIGITLTNRKEIEDKDKKIITRWEGKIKNITELILLTPPGITLGTPDKLEKCKDPKTELEKLECPCSMPFSSYDEQKCYDSCVEQVLKPCNTACASVNKDSKDPNAEIGCNNECSIVSDRCLDECRFLFQVNEGEGPTKEKYNAYSLDVSSKQFKDLNKDIDKSRSFVCRFEPSPAVLDESPITTRYFRVRTRYNYLLENSVTVNVESVPVGAKNTVPDSVVKTASDINRGHSLWFEGYSNELISAIASVESKYKHCCQEATKNSAGNCVDSGLKECPFGNLITSGSSFGIMQIQYNTKKSRDWADSLAREYCKKDSSGNDIKINNYDCNVLVGIAILKSKYDTFKGGCAGLKGISIACNTCKSNTAPYTPYSSYRGVEAALRGYNGWGCDPANSDPGYVEKILRAKATLKGKDIVDSSTLGGISREGIGMTDDATTQKPSPPTNPKAIDTPLESKSITVSWSASTATNVKYGVYRVNQLTRESRAYYDISGTSYIDRDVEDGIEYYYKITAISDYEESDPIQTNVVKSIDDTSAFTQGGP
ncbi:fibronectin type III domain-containing protein [Candidatus Woesearchaeota archaeon]|nr:fibronectin type III domain-containing protein [Candidatus Woesearchaeota archaeon]